MRITGLTSTTQPLDALTLWVQGPGLDIGVLNKVGTKDLESRFKSPKTHAAVMLTAHYILTKAIGCRQLRTYLGAVQKATNCKQLRTYLGAVQRVKVKGALLCRVHGLHLQCPTGKVPISYGVHQVMCCMTVPHVEHAC